MFKVDINGVTFKVRKEGNSVTLTSGNQILEEYDCVDDSLALYTYNTIRDTMKHLENFAMGE